MTENKVTDVIVLTGTNEDAAFGSLQLKGLAFSRAGRAEDFCRSVWVGSFKNTSFAAIQEYLDGASWRQRDLVEILQVREKAGSRVFRLHPRS